MAIQVRILTCLVVIPVTFFDIELELFFSQLVSLFVELSKLALLVKVVAELAKFFNNFVVLE